MNVDTPLWLAPVDIPTAMDVAEPSGPQAARAVSWHKALNRRVGRDGAPISLPSPISAPSEDVALQPRLRCSCYPLRAID